MFLILQYHAVDAGEIALKIPSSPTSSICEGHAVLSMNFVMMKLKTKCQACNRKNSNKVFRAGQAPGKHCRNCQELNVAYLCQVGLDRGSWTD